MKMTYIINIAIVLSLLSLYVDKGDHCSLGAPKVSCSKQKSSKDKSKDKDEDCAQDEKATMAKSKKAAELIKA